MTSDKSASISRRLIVGTFWNVAWRVVTRGLGFLSLLILAQLLTPGDIGIVSIATGITAVIDSLSQLGIREALIRLKDNSEELYDTAFTIQVARGLFTAAALAGLSLFANQWVGDVRVKGVLMAFAGAALIGGFENIGYVRVQRELNYRIQFTLQLLPRVLAFICTISIALFFRSYWAIVVGGIVARASGVVVTYLVYPHRPRFKLSGGEYLLSFSFWAWVGSLAGSFWSKSDPFLIGPFVGTVALGIYMLALEIGMLPITELLEPAAATLFPGFALAKNEGGSPNKMALEVATVLAFCTFPFALGLSACSGYVVTSLLGHKWDACQPIIAILTWVAAFASFSYVGPIALSAEGNVRQVAVTNVLAAVIKVAIFLAVRASHNLISISIAAVAVAGIESFLFMVQLRSLGSANLRPFLGSMARCLAATCLCACVLRFIPGTWSLVVMGRVPAFLTGGAIGVLTFLLFGACLMGLWSLCGRPLSAEVRAVDLFQRYVFGRLGFGRGSNV